MRALARNALELETHYAGRRFRAVEPRTGDRPRGLAMARGPRGTLWLGTDRGLYRVWDGGLVAGPAELAGEPVVAVAAGAGGRLWLATGTGRLAVLDGGSPQFIGGALPAGERGPAPRVHALAEDGDGVLWIGTSKGLFRWRGEALERREGPPVAGCPHPGLRWLAEAGRRSCLAGPDGTVWEIRHNAV